jgi:hypothetical protein
MAGFSKILCAQFKGAAEGEGLATSQETKELFLGFALIVKLAMLTGRDKKTTGQRRFWRLVSYETCQGYDTSFNVAIEDTYSKQGLCIHLSAVHK